MHSEYNEKPSRGEQCIYKEYNALALLDVYRGWNY